MAALLAVACATQIALPDEDAPPPIAPMRAGGGAPAPLPRPAVPSPARIAAAAAATRALFLPPPAPAAGGAGGPVVAGAISIGRRTLAIVEEPGGRIRQVPPGGRIGEWRLLRISPGDVTLGQGNARTRIPFGGRVTTPSDTVRGDRR